MKRSFNLIVLLGCLLFMPETPTRAQAKDVVVGVNLTNAPYDLSVAEQEAILGAMQRRAFASFARPYLARRRYLPARESALPSAFMPTESKYCGSWASTIPE